MTPDQLSHSSIPPLYPLRFDPIYKNKVWGGRDIQTLGRKLPTNPDTPDSPDTPIGESWELVDLDQTSPTGGGGNPERSVVANGPLAGQTLHDLIQRCGPHLMGKLPLTPAGQFPLLVKFLDASQPLSVQVHPSPDYARTHSDAHLKSEAWYILDAKPDAAIYKGVHPGITPEQFRQAIADGSVEKCMIKVPVKPGDCHYLPTGTCHALGAGILVAEVQTPSDTTFRVYDWGRTDRQLHIDQALQCITFGPPNVKHHEQRSHIAGIFTTVTRLVTCDHFRIDKVRMSQDYEQQIPYDQPAVWIVLQGKGTITPTDKPNDDQPPLPFEKGQTLLLPAGLDDARVALEQDTVWLEVTFPKALPEQIA